MTAQPPHLIHLYSCIHADCAASEQIITRQHVLADFLYATSTLTLDVPFERMLDMSFKRMPSDL